jgi:hypothetical protein
LKLTPEEQAVADEFGPRPPPVSRAWIVLIATVIFLVVLLLANFAIVTTCFRSRPFERAILANLGFMVVGTFGYALLDRYSRGASLGTYVAAIYGGPILAFVMDGLIVTQWETAGH